jgi:hypothetical protein
LPKFNPMVDDVDRSLDVAVEDLHGDKKPAASVSKIGAPMGASLKRSPWSKKQRRSCSSGTQTCPDQLLLLLPWRLGAEFYSAFYSKKLVNGKRGVNKRVTYLFAYFDYNLFGIKLVNALRHISFS